jgi:hypothetical protein
MTSPIPPPCLITLGDNTICGISFVQAAPAPPEFHPMTYALNLLLIVVALAFIGYCTFLGFGAAMCRLRTAVRQRFHAAVIEATQPSQNDRQKALLDGLLRLLRDKPEQWEACGNILTFIPTGLEIWISSDGTRADPWKLRAGEKCLTDMQLSLKNGRLLAEAIAAWRQNIVLSDSKSLQEQMIEMVNEHLASTTGPRNT